MAAILALLELGAVFGNPHIHSGLGIRKLTTNIFECHASLARRFVFQNTKDALVVVFLGDHDEVGRWLRNV